MNKVYSFPSPTYSDGDGGNTAESFIVIEPVDNGYVVRTESDDGDSKMVFVDKKELLKYLELVL